MPQYRYSACSRQGSPGRGVIEADSPAVARRALTRQGLYVIEVSELKKAPGDIVIGPQKLGLRDLSIVLRQFSAMLAAGVNVMKCLDILYRQSRASRMRAVLHAVLESVQRGQSLSEAMAEQKEAFPPILVSLVEAGEASGSLDSVISRTADHFEKESKNRSDAFSAMLYPLILLGMTVAVVIFLLTFIVPTFMKLFRSAGAKLPLPTRVILSLSAFLTRNWYFILLAIAAAAAACWFALRTQNGRFCWDRFKLTAPIFGKVGRTVIASRFARTLSILLHSGIPMMSSLEITGRVLGNAAVERALQAVREDVRKGASLSEAMGRHPLFPVMLCSMIGVGEESGALDDMLEKASRLYDNEADTALQRLVALIQPAVIIIMAFVVGAVILSVVLPMLSLMNAIR